MKQIRILLADDHNVLRDGLRLLLERQADFQVVAEASDGRRALALAQEHAPDVAVVDIAMPEMNGIELTRRLAECPKPVPVVILSMHEDESYILGALNAGARGYLLKDSVKAEVVAAIRAAVQGHSYFSQKISRLLSEDYFRDLSDKHKQDSLELLTDREREILQLIAEGKSNKEIANMLNVSAYTVETHRSHILHKLNLHTVPELILYAVRKGIIR
ncbi:MAG TPA: response regulator transcription factor [Bryobacteraceae bacterium]|jgi:DNA-binding NarL/FixJ family response regulator|nr:response regulator transcription factor [Bryobacteraceae bacterium]